jgi:outer membrane protein assembly factor BamB
MNQRALARCAALTVTALLPCVLMACGSSGTYSPAATTAVTTPPPTGLCQIGGGSLANTPWPKVHGDNQNLGRSNAPGSTTGTLKWSTIFAAGSQHWGSASIGADSTVYAVVSSYLVALDPATGAIKWQSERNVGLSAPPIVASDGTLYVPGSNEAGSNGVLYAINGSSGQTVCRFFPQDSSGGVIVGSPVLSPDKTLYVVTTGGRVYALDATNFAEKWNVSLSAQVQADLGLGPNGTLYVTQFDGTLVALNGATGAKLWEFPMGQASPGGTGGAPVVAPNGMVYAGSWASGKVYAINAVSGAKVWEFATGGRIQSSASIGPDGTVYISSMAGGALEGYGGPLFALDGNTGAKKWERVPPSDPYGNGTPFESYGTPVVAGDGTVYVTAAVPDRSGRVYAFDGQSGAVKWTLNIPEEIISSEGTFSGQVPAIAADGTVYIGTFKNRFYAIR